MTDDKGRVSFGENLARFSFDRYGARVNPHPSRRRHRLFMAASHSLYALYLNIQGAD
jgi:hypothetical protein